MIPPVGMVDLGIRVIRNVGCGLQVGWLRKMTTCNLQQTTNNPQLTTDKTMERSNLWRWICICLAVGSWSFLLLSLGSFHPTDWPSHAVHPYPPVANLCGPAGAFCAYYLFLVVGQGAFPMLFFSGVCIVLYIAHNRVSDPWMRA